MEDEDIRQLHKRTRQTLPQSGKKLNTIFERILSACFLDLTMQIPLITKTYLACIAGSIFYFVASERCLLATFLLQDNLQNFVHPLNIFKINFLLKNTESRKMPTTVTKCLCFNR